MVFSLGAYRQDVLQKPAQRESGTGGFTLWAESSLGVGEDLNTAAARERYLLDEALFQDVHFVPLRQNFGEEASCLNLNRATVPRLVGIDPTQLSSREAFSFQTHEGNSNEPWLLLSQPRTAKQPIPVIGDHASVTWALHKKVGETLTYRDERGEEFEVKIVATVANSILQGNLLMDQSAFLEKFPSITADRSFLIDAPVERREEIAAALTRALSDQGMAVERSEIRLARLAAVQNSYLLIFQSLSALGLLVGSIGLGTVLLRNLWERRGEMALLKAVGYSRNSIQTMVFVEHVSLLGLGLVLGLVPAALAILPTALSPTAGFPWRQAGWMLLLLVGNGILWVWIATQLALRGPTIQSLTSESN